MTRARAACRSRRPRRPRGREARRDRRPSRPRPSPDPARDRSGSPAVRSRCGWRSGPCASLAAQRDQVLTGLHRILILDEEALDYTVLVALDLVEVLHHLDQADDVSACDAVSLVHERIVVGAGAAVEGARHRRLDRPLIGHLTSLYPAGA